MRFAHADHRASARMLGFALVFGEGAGWLAFSAVIHARLSRTERAALAASALIAVDDEDLEPTLDAALGGAGEPMPWLVSPLDEASTWAAIASNEERRSYALAAFSAMPPGDQREFLAYARSRAA